MLPLIMAACGAAGAAVGVLTTKAANEKDKQAIKRYEKVNAELINNKDRLQKQYYELSNRSKKQINDLNFKIAESEMEKDLVYLALSLYHELMTLREDIDINPSFDVLVEFHRAIILTNYVLKQLDKHLVPVTQDYFSRTLKRIDERDNLSKEQLFNFMAVLMNPQQDNVTSILGEIQNEIFSQQSIIDLTDLAEENSNKILKEKSLQLQEKTLSDNVECLVKQGINCFELEKHEEALTYFNEAICIEPNHDESWYYQSQIFYVLNENDKALDLIDRAIAINSQEGIYYYQKSLCLSEFDLSNDALKCINKAIHLEPSEDLYLYQKSDFLCSFEEYEKALNLVDQAINLNPTDFLYLSHRGVVLYYLNEYDEALNSLDKAIEIYPNYDYAWYWRGLVLFEMKVLLFIDRKNEALESFDQAISINPDNAEYWYWRARAFLDLLQQQEAIQSLERAIAIEPNNDDYRKLRNTIIQ